MTTNCAGRFPDLCVCKTEFPSVDNYDYETNFATRGIDNRNFRWQDIFVDANYLFLEVTESGGFERNSFASIGGVTGTTGLWAITTGNNTEGTAYLPWYVRGGYTYYIPKSGVKARLENLPSYPAVEDRSNPGAWVAPIEGDNSIGLFCWSQYLPTVFSSPYIVSPTGLDNSEKYQVYLQARNNLTVYPSGFPGVMPPRLKVYLEARTGSTSIGYYDPILNRWANTEPVSWYKVTSNKISEIKFDFQPSSSTLAEADRYVLWIKTDSTGSFITVDDIHIDQYMETNPFTSGFIPESYILQISPDLGWANKDLMLSQKTGHVNPFVKTFGPFSTDDGNLSDNLDGSVTATISLSDFENVINKKYTKYVWRAFATSPNGDMSRASYPQSFDYVGQVLEKDFSVLSVNDDPLSLTKTIVGTKNSRLEIVVDGVSNYPGLEYPTPTTWKVDIQVLTEKQLVKIYGRDDGGATSKIQYIELQNKLYPLTNEYLWNTFDEHGLLMDTKRIPEESNIAYYNRIKDVNRNPAGSNFIGVANSSNRELGLIKIPEAISLSIPKDNFGLSSHSSVFIEFDSVCFRARTNSMVYTEKCYLDPIYHTLKLSKKPVELPYKIVSDSGITIPSSAVSFDIDEDSPSAHRLKINYPQAFGAYINIEYFYVEELLYKHYKTLGELTEQIKKLKDHLGQTLLNIKLNMQLSGGEDCLGLFIDNVDISGDAIYSIPWSKLKIRRISDKQFREYFSNEEYSYKNTKFYSYINELQSNSRTLWGSVEADRDFWDAADSTSMSFDHIPTTMDPDIYDYSTSSGMHSSKKIDSEEIWARRYVGDFGENIENKGLTPDLFQPGVAHTNDLAPSIHVQQTKVIYTDPYRSIISKTRLENNIVIFSGVR